MEKELVTNVRMLSVDMIARANSGHPGLPLGAAPLAVTLFSEHLKVNPLNPKWFNRDRFVLSAGHGSALLYSLLHVFGYAISTEDLKQFRQLNSKTPGHPEAELTAGVDASSGPLGQGIAVAVGMAMAEAHLASHYNRTNFNIIDHFTYCLVGDGCLMEGISAEAMSISGALKLKKLIVLYDSNAITLDGELRFSSQDNMEKRCETYNWDYMCVDDGNDLAAISEAITCAKKTEKPVMIEIKTIIGHGARKVAGTSKVHGNPIVGEELAALKNFYDWKLAPFELSEKTKTLQEAYQQKGAANEKSWLQLFAAYSEQYPTLANELSQNLSNDFNERIKSLENPFIKTKQISTREASGIILNQLAEKLPLFGGSADLSSSNKTYLNAKGDFSATSYQGQNIWFGIREFFMGAALNGIALHKGLIPFGATFFVFSDYLKSAIRSAALMKLPVIYVMTHDSLAVGEDGPTHQPVEQLAGFRAMPNLHVFRPADANETFSVYQYIIQNPTSPNMLILSRQALPNLSPEEVPINRGAYILKEEVDKLDLVLVATGSEVSLAIQIADQLSHYSVRVVSAPSLELFARQPKAYQEKVIPKTVPSFSIEMAAEFGWHAFVDYPIGIDQYGKSAPSSDLAFDYGFTSEQLSKHIQSILKRGV